MPNTNNAPVAAVNRSQMRALHEAANAALVARGPGALVKVTLPDGTAAEAYAADIWRGEGGQDIRVLNERKGYEYWWASQLSAAE
jgi:hypothetical protein